LNERLDRLNFGKLFAAMSTASKTNFHLFFQVFLIDMKELKEGKHTEGASYDDTTLS
jgi:hypothetical protein